MHSMKSMHSMKLLFLPPTTVALCVLAALTSGSLVYLMSRTGQHFPPRPVHSSPSSKQLPLTLNESSPANSHDLRNLKHEFEQHQEALDEVQSFAAQAETDLQRFKEQILALQMELEQVKHDTQATQNRLQELTGDSITLAKCATDVNELVDSIEKLTPTNLNLIEIGRKVEGLQNSQTFQDGACRRSREIARRFLQASP